MNKQLIALAFAAAAGVSASSAFAAPETFSTDASHSQATFEVNHLGFSTQRGHFTKSTGKVTLDLAAKTGSVEFSVDVKSLDMGMEKWTKHVLSDDLLASDKFPAITFKSTKLVFNGDAVVGAEGQFTLHGVTKPLTLAVAGFKCGNHPMNKKTMCGGDITATIKRSDFDVKYGLPAIGDDVKLIVPVEAFKD